MMNDFLIHTVPGSPFARAVAMTLEEKHAQWRVRALTPPMIKQHPHLAYHPFGRVPAVEHGDFVLYETQAVLRYIDRVLPSPSLTPAEPQAAARMDQVMNINDWYLFQGCANVIVWNRVLGPRVVGITPDEAAIAGAMPRARIVVQELTRIVGEQSYFAGDRISLADLIVAPQLDYFAEAPEWQALTVNAAPLVRWLARMRSRPSMRVTTWEAVAAKAA
jgi:glutathione S-transferase